MPTSPSANLGLVAPLSSEAISASGTQDFLSLIQALDAASAGPVVTRAVEGTLANLNATVQPFGTLYRCTDVSCAFIRSNSSTWVYLPMGQSGPPVGTTMQYGGTVDPIDPDGTTRWNICDGRTISRATYSSCFAIIGTTYGAGNGSTTFNIPNGQGNALVGSSGSFSLGSSGGEQNHTLLVGEIPSHSHSDSGHTHSDSGHTHSLATNNMAPQATTSQTLSGGDREAVAGTASLGTTTASANIQNAAANIQNAGGSAGVTQGHNNMQPYVVVNHIIRVL